ncbi:MAG TPA: hypothetical protein VK432_03565 [Stellaceae bacterium]|nr:hypothetical protein [Stellaceae bacterium]
MRRRFSPLFPLVAAALVAALPAMAQSPFQSAPGPAPPIARPAPHPRAQQQDEELPPTVNTVPATPAPAPAPPPPPPAPSLAGVWHFWSNCPLDPGGDLTFSPTGSEQYTVSGSDGIIPVTVTGWVSGKTVHLEANPPLNHVVWQGTVDSPTAMGGTVIPAIGFNCQWSGRKK